MFLKNRQCAACGSSLVVQSEQFRHPHCFVCGENHPAIPYPMRGPVSQLIERIEFDGKKFARKETVLPPLITMIDGYAYYTVSLRTGKWRESASDTRRIRGGS